MIDWMFIFALLVGSNCLLTNGFGVLTLQRSKNNMWFTLINSCFMMFTIVSCTTIYRLVYGLLKSYNLTSLGILVIVALCGIFGFATMQIIKLISKEMYYYYDTTYSFVVNLGTSIGILLCLDFTGSIAACVLTGIFASLAYAAVSVIFSLNYYRLANKKISRRVRPVPITIITVAVLAMIIYAITSCI